MRVLLDTQLLLWSLGSPGKLSTKARDMIDAGEVHVSAASLWEITIKNALGKLPADPRAILAALEPSGFSVLAISAEHAVKVADLPTLHRDPFDRMLVAQAMSEPMILLTNDDALGGYGPFVTIA